MRQVAVGCQGDLNANLTTGGEDVDEFADGAEGQAGDGAVDVADHALAVDDERAPAGEAHRPERAVRLGCRLVGVGQQGEAEAVLLGEAAVALHVLG
jgi:hypothetical protein